MKQSRKDTLLAADHIWKRDNDWRVDISDKVYCITWQFGSIHQCKVMIKYNDEEVGICLGHRSTRNAAMNHTIEWAEAFIKNGPPSREQVFNDCYTQYPDTYKTHIDVITRLFFVIGASYKWVDGAIMNCAPEDHLEYKRRKEQAKSDPLKIRTDNLFREIIAGEMASEIEKEKLRKLLLDYEPSGQQRPLPDDGKVKAFYPVSNGYSNITIVPDDVRPEWLAIAYETAILLRDRSGISNSNGGLNKEEWQASNKEIGARVVNELEKRFPQLKDF